MHKWIAGYSNRPENHPPIANSTAYLEKKIAARRDSYETRVMEARVPLQIGLTADPLQPLEKSAGATLAHLKILKDIDYPTIIITKFPGLLTTPEYHKIISEMPFVAHVSISGLDGRLEPGAPSPQDRLEAVHSLVEAGLNVQVRLWPFIPEVTNLEASLDAIEATGCEDVLVSLLEIVNRGHWQKDFDAALGYNYMASLKMSGRYRFKSNCNWHQFHPDDWRSKLVEIRDAILDRGMRCPTTDYLDDRWSCCCGVERFPGFENVAGYSLNINGQRFGPEPITFADYMDGHDCPWRAEYELMYWDKGRLDGMLPGLVFNSEDKTYVRL
jgi:DNA repair photolyase